MSLADSQAAPDGEASADAPSFGKGYRRYAIGLLLLIYILNFLDRQIVAILAEPIRNDLGLADWQLGVLTGLSFALFYTLLGFPVARLAERGDRPMIISAAVAVWSLCTALCGLAQSFTQLVLARIGVGVGEAGCTPPAVSLIADYTPKAERAWTMSLYALGSPIGGLLGMALGGLIADAYGWRAAFLIVGAPGMLVALIAALTLREPRRRAKAQRDVEAPPALREALSELRTKRAFWKLVAGGAVKSFVTYGMTAFLGSFFFRNHGDQLAGYAASVGLQTVGFVGVALGLCTGIAGMVGALVGGRLVDHFARKDARAYARIPAIGMLLGVPFYMAALLSPSPLWALALLAAPAMLGNMWIGPIYAAIQGLVRPRIRATATATLLFTTNLVGLGLGPLAVGVVSDLISEGMGLGPASGVKWSIIIFTLLGAPAALIYWSAARTMREELVN